MCGFQSRNFQELTRSYFTSSKGKNQIVLPVNFNNRAFKAQFSLRNVKAIHVLAEF